MYDRLVAWLEKRRSEFHCQADIRPYLQFKIGGKVGLLIVCQSAADLAACLQQVCSRKIPFVVIGGGSNIAFGDGLTRAVALVYQSGATGAMQVIDDQTLQVDGGIKNQLFLSWCASQRAGGLEFLSGIPGTLGGAAAVNAGAFGRSMADVVLGAEIVDEKGVKRTVDAAYFAFSYRDSRFKLGRETILSLRLKFSAQAEAVIARKIKENMEYRLAHHPSYRCHSAGCFFKNPLVQGAKRSAGKIIEECGLKNLTVGALTVANAHGNFLLNRGGAAFKDLLRLEKEIKITVARRTGISLEREVIYVSPQGKKY